jgi:Arc/MetJ family transcription regulator
MRTNIDIDDNLIAKAIELSGLKTKKRAIEEALKEFVKINQRKRMDKLRGTFSWEGNLDEWRSNRVNYDF